MMPSSAAVWLLILGGLWLVHAGWRVSDARWGRLSVSWPVPWPQLAASTRRAVRATAIVAGLAAVTWGAWLAVLLSR